MPKSERKILLDFEKPLAELENRINQIRELAKDCDSVDVSEQIHQLEAKATQLRQEIFSSLSPVSKKISTRVKWNCRYSRFRANDIQGKW